MVIAPHDFRDEEFFQPKDIFEKAGFAVVIASKGVKTSKGVMGGITPVDKELDQINVNDYGGVIFVGGPGSAVYFHDQEALNLAKMTLQNQKLLGAICIAPSILANAGLLEGKKATCFSSEAEHLKAKGAIYTGQDVTIDDEDDKIVTAFGPQAAQKFGQTIVNLLKKPLA